MERIYGVELRKEGFVATPAHKYVPEPRGDSNFDLSDNYRKVSDHLQERGAIPLSGLIDSDEAMMERVKEHFPRNTARVDIRNPSDYRDTDTVYVLDDALVHQHMTRARNTQSGDRVIAHNVSIWTPNTEFRYVPEKISSVLLGYERKVVHAEGGHIRNNPKLSTVSDVLSELESKVQISMAELQ